MRWDDGFVKEWLDRAGDPDPEEEVLEPEGEPWVVISVEDFYDLLMEQQEQM